jgi:hypothetical protein
MIRKSDLTEFDPKSVTLKGVVRLILKSRHFFKSRQTD